MKIKLPKRELLWTTIYNIEHIPSFIITSDKARTMYYLYSINSYGITSRIKQSKDPSKIDNYAVSKLKRK